MNSILIIEDNEQLGSLVRDFLNKEGYDSVLETTAETALKKMEDKSFELVLLDVMLPGIDGFSMCEKIREKSSIPILMMSAKTDDESKLRGYAGGADDYIEKPFSIPVLVAKVGALMKRRNIDASNEVIKSNGITLNIKSRIVTKNDVPIALNVKEFDVLYYLMKNKGQVISKEKLFDEVWGNDCVSEYITLNVHIRWLREKLEEDSKNPKLIQTVWRVGYKFGE